MAAGAPGSWLRRIWATKGLARVRRLLLGTPGVERVAAELEQFARTARQAVAEVRCGFEVVVVWRGRWRIGRLNSA